MLAVIKKEDSGFVAQFERHLGHSVENVWSMLTDNEQLEKWFSELWVDDLCVGGTIKFDMRDGSFEEMKITALEVNAVLEYTWAEDRVRFELCSESDGCQLVLKEKINQMTSHTPRDLAGWHVCLDVIEALLDGRMIESRESEWNHWYPKYVQAVENANQ